jgi:hypothetical protein
MCSQKLLGKKEAIWDRRCGSRGKCLLCKLEALSSNPSPTKKQNNKKKEAIYL